MVSFLAFGLSAAVLIIAFIVSSLRTRKRHALPLPPGPASLPILGNFLSLPTQQPWVTYANWSKALQSDLISVKAFNQVTLVINSKKLAKELYEGRSAKYSDRPALVSIELMGWDFNTGLLPYSEKWRARRRLLHQTLHAAAAQEYRPMQREKVHELLYKLHRDPENFEAHISSLGSSVAIAVAYGDVGGKQDDFIRPAREAIDTLSLMGTPHSVIVNSLPILRHFPGWLPGFGFQVLAQECRKLTADMQNVPWTFVEQAMTDKTATPSMALKILQDLDGTDAGPDLVQAAKDACAVTFASMYPGADTTVSAMATAVLGLLLHPEVQHRAQQEIDQVIGGHRLPTYEDRNSLPYVEAIYREALRWYPVAPLSVARAAFEDDIYGDYFIPKGTSLLANVWAMTRNAEEYPEPESFKPERFLLPNGTLNDDDMRYVFGFGRRFCSGRHLADATIWLMIASVLSVFHLIPAKDENGKEVPVEVEYTSGLVILNSLAIEGIPVCVHSPCVASCVKEMAVRRDWSYSGLQIDRPLLTRSPHRGLSISMRRFDQVAVDGQSNATVATIATVGTSAPNNSDLNFQFLMRNDLSRSGLSICKRLYYRSPAHYSPFNKEVSLIFCNCFCRDNIETLPHA
ncbi:cytochrome P450, partial [Dentipellis sp. KUC8613]